MVRHAKSSRDGHYQSDFERTLNDRGKKNALEMSKLLQMKNVTPDLIISSPATRALSTAEIFAGELHYKRDKIEIDGRIYNATIRDLMNIVREIDNKYKTVLLFGHNPGLLNFVNLLSNKFFSEMPTCAVVGLQLDADFWEKVERYCGKVFLFEYPQRHH